jgi:hypothetical protein
MLSQRLNESDGVRAEMRSVLVRRREGVEMLMEGGTRLEDCLRSGGEKAVVVVPEPSIE